MLYFSLIKSGKQLHQKYVAIISLSDFKETLLFIPEVALNNRHLELFGSFTPRHRYQIKQ